MGQLNSQENNNTVNVGEVTQLLRQWNEGSKDAMSQVLDLLYKELHTRAKRELYGNSSTLQPTALINEVYLSLIERKKFELQNRGHFIWFASQLMRQILVDQLRAKLAAKRGSGERPVSIDDQFDLAQRQDLEPTTILALDQALKKLEELDERQAKMVELHFFAGLTVAELAEIFDVAEITVKRQFRNARMWLAKELKTNRDLNL